MQENKVVTSIAIDAPVDRVWRALVAFDQYKQWHPTLEVLSGSAVPGSAIHMRIAAGTASERTAQGEILEVSPGRLLSWEGGIPDLLWGHHRFELVAQGGRTHLTNSESFTGSMADEAISTGRAILVAEFDEANRALKAHAERGDPDPRS